MIIIGNPFKSFMHIFLIGTILLSCQKKSTSRPPSLTESKVETAVENNSQQTVNPDIPKGGDANGGDTLTSLPLSTHTLFTKKSVDGNCMKLNFQVTNANEPISRAGVVFSILSSVADNNVGTIEPGNAYTDNEGIASTTYCSGESELTIQVQARAGELTSATDPINITLKPTFSFKFVRADTPIVEAPQQTAQHENEPDEEGNEAAQDDLKPISIGVLKLNLIDSGPNDCTTLYFRLAKSDQPITGSEIEFRSQIDFPKGSKLAKKDNASPTTAIDPSNGKTYATYLATSNSDGELAVPVCAGVSLGTIVVSGQYLTEENKTLTAHGPVITITAGLTNFQSMSLTYDPINSRTVRGFFNTNANHIQPFEIKLSSRQDGDVITDYPVAVASELGKIVLENGGIPGDDGIVRFTLQALHIVDQYPFQTTVFPDHIDSVHQTRCSAQALHAYHQTLTAPNVFTFRELRNNWLNTIVYMVRGQESFHDANRNGRYDEGGDGFWDKNQNGIYDKCGAVTVDQPVDNPEELCDELTFDAGGDGVFDPNSEWFIDLPTPFIDVDKNGTFDSKIDTLIGDEYHPPNKKRDADSIIWKYDILPIYMGTSSYAMTHGDFSTLFGNDSIGESYFRNYYENVRQIPDHYVSKVFNNAVTHAHFFADGDNLEREDPEEGYGYVNRYIFAHGICGNPVPGGSQIKIGTTVTSNPTYGDRAYNTHIFVQPLDRFREPSRRILSQSTGGPEATLNFNYVDHPASAASYPIRFRLAVAPCTNVCTGAVATPGVACDGKAATIDVSLHDKKDPIADGTDIEVTTVAQTMSINAVKTCTCGANSFFQHGVCTCQAGYELNEAGTACVLVPVE